MAMYTNREAVKARLRGKVRFTQDSDDLNKMDTVLLDRLINEAEGQVELDLSPRYSNPFVGDNGEPFTQLPKRPTQEVLRTLCEIQSVMMILNTDFGRGGSNSGDKYAEGLEKRYKTIVERLLEKKDKSNMWKYPPLPSLQLAYFNEDGDTGYFGQVLKSGITHNHGDFPHAQINSPGETFFNGTVDIDPIERGDFGSRDPNDQD